MPGFIYCFSDGLTKIRKSYEILGAAKSGLALFYNASTLVKVCA